MDTLIINLVLLAAFIAILVKSAIFAINSIVRFSKITGIGELAAGFVIVAPLALFLLLRTSKIRILHSALLFGIFAVFLIVLYEIQLQLVDYVYFRSFTTKN